ncbi:hypothetical protein SAY87_003239 [Trapa incisa]|uniref:Bidirectional sugar transporter SWEET n=1 Tax=Trapa incisa TaxID=236973 RepID=A0AAN7KNV3_9MYRT|nr:hypothetical protein SAY87_003239 [Trapa incisa]
MQIQSISTVINVADLVLIYWSGPLTPIILSFIRIRRSRKENFYFLPYTPSHHRHLVKMVHTEILRTVVGIIGNVISFGLFLSPLPTFIYICKTKSVQAFKPDPYVVTVLNCMMWVFYGLPFVHPDSILVVTINSIGLAMELVYVCIFFIFSTWPARKKICIILLAEVIFLAAVVLITMLLFHTTKMRSLFVGILCILFTIGMYAAPLTVMKLVIKTKSVKFMPFYLSLANFLNGIVWSIYALLKFDINLLLPNGLGTLSGLVQLLLYALYYKTTNWEEEEQQEETTANVELHSSNNGA